jgi:phosphoglycerate dehydrogenase-like enzyme
MSHKPDLPAVPAVPFRVVAVDPPQPRPLEVFSAALRPPEFAFAHPTGREKDDELLRLLSGANALITRWRFVDGEMMRAAGPALRLVQVMGHLPDRVDLAAARDAGISVAVMPSKGAIAVAEHAMALMLALARRLIPSHRGVVTGAYRSRGLTPSPTTETQFAFNWLGDTGVSELNGKTLGVIGFGEIGQELARRARAFEMPVVYHDLRPLPEPYDRVLGVRYAPLDELLAACDYLSLHLPHTPASDRILNARTLSLMKPTSFIVNAARGGLIDEQVLAALLSARKLAGAGLDVFVDEPLAADHPLLGLDNVVLTPHVGGGSGGGQRLHAQETAENIARVARGERPRHLVTGHASIEP